MMLAGVEGIDGSGKTTLVTALAAVLAGRGITVVTHREPSGGPVGRLFRQLSADGEHDPGVLALLSAADRLDQQVVLTRPGPGLVVSDRYYLSGLAYHAADGVDPVFYQWLNDGARRPDLYLFLDVAPAIAAARRRGQPASDRWEHPAMIARIPAAYERALELITDTEAAVVTRLDAAQQPPAVLAQALNALSPLLASISGGDHGLP
jgi:dTMP kinase